MMKKVIHCEKCKEPIVDNSDLVVATVFFEVYPFHSYCYAVDIKGAKTVILSNQPLNGFASNFKFSSIIIIAILWAILADPSIKWAAVIAIPFIIYRLYAYLMFERHVT